MPLPPQLELVHRAICAGVLGQIQWKPSAAEFVRSDPDLNGLTPDEIRRTLRAFVKVGNQLEVRREIRKEYVAQHPDHPYWYRALIPLDVCDERLFIELVLLYDEDDPDDSFVEIVSAHF